MVSVDKAVIAKLNKANEKFEILVDPVKALEIKSGKSVPINDLAVSQEVYSDSAKGKRASPQTLNKIFGTNDFEQIALIIIKDGDVQLTTEQRKKMLEDKIKSVAAIISRQGVDPRSGAPHPAERILHAMEQARVRIDINKSAEEQVDTTIKAITSIIPIKLEKVEIEIKIPATYSSKCANIIRGFGAPRKENWGGDGSYTAIIEIPAGLQNDIYNKINAFTKGEASIKVTKRIGV